MAANNGGPGWDMKVPFFAALLAAVAATGSYYGQREATSVSQAEIKGGIILLTSEITGLKASVSRMEVGRYTALDSARDNAWRDERAMDLVKRVGELENVRRRR